MKDLSIGYWLGKPSCEVSNDIVMRKSKERKCDSMGVQITEEENRQVKRMSDDVQEKIKDNLE